MSARVRLAVVLLLGVLVAACAPDPEEATDPAGDCPPQVGTEVAEVIAAQLEAFAADDYAGALALASRRFQAGTEPGAFRRMIETSFPQVADSREHRVLGCRLVATDVVHALVAVTGRDGSREEVVYELVEEERDGPTPRWAVAGAIPHQRGDSLTA